MHDESARAVARIDGTTVQPVAATVPHPQRERSDGRATDGEPPPAAEPGARTAGAPGHRTTDLAYHVDAESKRVSVQVVDRETGAVVRSFPLFLPGQEARIDGEPDGAEAGTPRGALVDAKA